MGRVALPCGDPARFFLGGASFLFSLGIVVGRGVVVCPWKRVSGTLPIYMHGALQWARLWRGKQWGTEMYVASREWGIDGLAKQ